VIVEKATRPNNASAARRSRWLFCSLRYHLQSRSKLLPSQPDPAGIAYRGQDQRRGRRRNSFVVAEPTDKNAADYAQKKKTLTSIKPSGEKASGRKLADSVGHLRIGTNFAWTLNTGYLVLLCKLDSRWLTADWSARRTPAT